MQDWQRDRNYRKYENPDGTFTYIITIAGEKISVTKEVFDAYSQEDRRERYCDERDVGRLLSLDKLDEDSVPLICFAERHSESAEDTAIRELQMSRMVEVLALLTPDERTLIEALFLESISARELARSIGVYHRTIIYRRDKILEKLRRLM